MTFIWRLFQKKLQHQTTDRQFYYIFLGDFYKVINYYNNQKTKNIKELNYAVWIDSTYEMDDSGGGQPHGYKNRHELSKSNWTRRF